MTPESNTGETPQEKVPEQGHILDVAFIIGQLEDLVKFSLECENKELKPGISFVEVHKKLLAIQKDIERFQEIYRQHLALFNLKPEDLRPTPEQIESLDPKDRKIYERMQTLKETCESARDRIYESLHTSPETLKVVEDELKDKSKEKIRRKGKFKGMGGKQGWIPT